MSDDPQTLHQIDVRMVKFEARLDSLRAEIQNHDARRTAEHLSLADALRHAKDKAEKDLSNRIDPLLARVVSLENAHREVAKELQSFSKNYVRVLGLIEAAKNDIAGLQREDKKIEGTLSRVAWFAFPLLITIIGFLLVQQFFKV